MYNKRNQASVSFVKSTLSLQQEYIIKSSRRGSRDKLCDVVTKCYGLYFESCDHIGVQCYSGVLVSCDHVRGSARGRPVPRDLV